MPPQIYEWSNLVLRWIHVFAAIAWVGSIYGLVKMARLTAADKSDPAWIPLGADILTAAERRARASRSLRRSVSRWFARYWPPG